MKNNEVKTKEIANEKACEILNNIEFKNSENEISAIESVSSYILSIELKTNKKMAQKINYHAISQPDMKSFNEELKKYTDKGYVPYGGMLSALAYSGEAYVAIRSYSILLGKTSDVK